jgi:dihydroorotate dehydrogenase
MNATNTTEAQYHLRVPPNSQETGGLSGAPLLAAMTRAERSGPA